MSSARWTGHWGDRKRFWDCRRLDEFSCMVEPRRHEISKSSRPSTYRNCLYNFLFSPFTATGRPSARLFDSVHSRPLFMTRRRSGDETVLSKWKTKQMLQLDNVGSLVAIPHFLPLPQLFPIPIATNNQYNISLLFILFCLFKITDKGPEGH